MIDCLQFKKRNNQSLHDRHPKKISVKSKNLPPLLKRYLKPKRKKPKLIKKMQARLRKKLLLLKKIQLQKKIMPRYQKIELMKLNNILINYLLMKELISRLIPRMKNHKNKIRLRVLLIVYKLIRMNSKELAMILSYLLLKTI